MADARITQAVLLSIGDQAPPDARITHGLALVLGAEAPPVRITHALVMALVYALPCLSQRCQCWSIVRTDGQGYYYTTHDEPVVFRGQIYTPCESLSATASSEGGVSNGTGDVAINGIASVDGIDAGDMMNGIFDNARVEVWEVQWGDADPGATPVRISAGNIGTITHEGAGYKAELRTAGARLSQQPLLKVHTSSCRAKLGDAECKVDLEALRVSGSVTGTLPRLAHRRQTFRSFFDTSRTEAENYFSRGELTWVTGPNAGIRMEVKVYDHLTGRMDLWLPMPYEIAVGDTYTLVPGCDLLPATCKGTFNNYLNNRAFPDLPGADAIADYPNAKGTSVE